MHLLFKLYLRFSEPVLFQVWLLYVSVLIWNERIGFTHVSWKQVTKKEAFRLKNVWKRSCSLVGGWKEKISKTLRWSNLTLDKIKLFHCHLAFFKKKSSMFEVNCFSSMYKFSGYFRKRLYQQAYRFRAVASHFFPLHPRCRSRKGKGVVRGLRR